MSEPLTKDVGERPLQALSDAHPGRSCRRGGRRWRREGELMPGRVLEAPEGYDPLEVDAMSAEAAAIIDELTQRRKANGASS
jgi:hypothetical protein